MRSLLNQETRYQDYILTVKALSDRELFTHIAAGEEAALDELYKRYRSQIYRFLVHRTGSEQAAEELIQEVFLAAWQGARKFRGTAAVKTWLLRVAYYRAATWVKSVSRATDAPLAETLPFEGLLPEDKVAMDGQAEAVRAAIAELSDHHRTAVELIFYHGLTYQEAARVVDCPMGTMKSRVSHAIKLLGGRLIRDGLDKP